MFLQDVVFVPLWVAQSQPGAVAVVCHWRAQAPDMVDPVSYTHLTLPTMAVV